MKILYFVPYVPNIIRVRPYQLIRSLSVRGHQVTVATLWNKPQEVEDLENLKSLCQRVIAFPLPTWKSLLNCLLVLPSSEPLQAAYCWNDLAARKIYNISLNDQKELSFDILHIEHLRGARYGIYLGEKCRTLYGTNYTCPIVWDSVDCISLLFRQASTQSNRLLSRLFAKFELRRTERYERRLLKYFERIIVTSEKDKNALLSLLPNSDNSGQKIKILPNGVDLNYFTPGSYAGREKETLVISGKMSYHANIAMARYMVDEIMPLIWAEKPYTKLWIVGKDPPREIQKLGCNPLITVTGTVPDIRPFLTRATLAVAPIQYGVGIQNKVLEAMSCATPMVCTPQAVSALSVQNGQEIIVKENAVELSNAILELLSNENERLSLGQNARMYVEKNHDWLDITSRLEILYQEMNNHFHDRGVPKRS